MIDLRVSALFECRFEPLLALFDRQFPWEILKALPAYINGLIERGLEGYAAFSDGVLMGSGVTVAPTAVIVPPAIIGPDTEIRPGAYLRGNVIIGKNCVIGNSTEIKNAVLLDHVQAPHYNYVGDSILGNGAHLGAGAICSNLKSDKTDVVIHAETPYATGLRKLGGLIGDHAEIGCGCVLNPGTVIGKNTCVYPLVSLRGCYPENSIVKSAAVTVPKTERRGAGRGLPDKGPGGEETTPVFP